MPEIDLNIPIEVGKQYIDKQNLLKWCEHIRYVSDPNDSTGVTGLCRKCYHS